MSGPAPGHGGRPPIPTEQKRRRGTLEKSRLPAVRSVEVPSVDIEKLMDGPVIQGLVDAGMAPWIAPSDTPTVRLAQRLWDDMERLRAALDEEWNEPAFRAYRDTIKELRACLAALGMSPSERTRLGVAEVKARSALAEMMDRRGRRAGTRASLGAPSERAMGTTS